MAVTEDVARLRLETVGSETIDALRARLAQLTTDMGNLVAAYGRGEVAEREFDQQARALQAGHAGLTMAVKDLGGTLDQGGSKVAGLGQTFLQSGRFVQDFAQGGIGGVLNNIEGLSMALGGGAGLAGVLTIVGVGFALLKKPIVEFWDSLSSGDVKTVAEGLDTLKERIKDIAEKPHKVALEVLELANARAEVERIEAGLKAIDALNKSQTKYEAESGRTVADLIANAPGGGQAVRGTLVAQLAREGEEGSAVLPEARARVEELTAEIGRVRELQKGAVDPEVMGALERQITGMELELRAANTRLTDAQTEIGERAAAAAGGLIDQAQKGYGGGQENAQRELARRLGAAGMETTATRIRAASPGNRQAAELEAEGARIEAESLKELDQVRRDRSNALAEELESQGAEIEAKTKADMKADEEERDREAGERKKSAAAEKATQEATYKTFAGTDIDERAALSLAQMRAAGGETDRFGRFRALTEEQQEDLLRRQATVEVRRANPRLNPLQVSAVASRLVTGARERTDEVYQQQRGEVATQARMSGQQLSASELNVAATRGTLGLLAALIPRIDRVEKAALANLRQVESMAPRSRPAVKARGR